MAIRNISVPWLLLLLCVQTLAGEVLPQGGGQPPSVPGLPGRQTLRLVQDDAQDYMISKIYTLKYIQSNDIAPFVTGIVKRYNMNSSVSCFNYVYGNVNQQILSVTAPEKIMACVTAFLDMADRQISGVPPNGDSIRGTGIAAGLYRPKYRSGQTLIDIIVNAVINAGPYSSLYGYDSNSNQIYWKDNLSDTLYVYTFLTYLDRPPPQIRMKFSLLELRESTLRDIGIDYLAWKNGPGLNLFQVGFQALDLSSSGSAALQSFSGPLGGFFFAPQFDASFIRILEQSGNAERETTGELTVSNSDTRSYAISFNGAFQNIVKNSNDRTSVTAPDLSAQSHSCNITIVKPVACINNSKGTDFAIAPYFPGENANVPGVLNFGYTLKNSGGVEQSNFGTELISVSTVSGNAVIPLNEESVLGVWESTREVEENIGVPFLSEIPILKYLFSTTVTNREKSYIFLTVTPCIPDTAAAEKFPRN